MARPAGNAPTARRKSGKWKYFYLKVADKGPQLHKSLFINRGADTIITWCYPLEKRVAYTYSDTREHRDPAFTTQEVCKMLMRVRKTVEWAILRGEFEPPQHVYSLDEKRKKIKYMWHEKDILAAHAYFTTVHRGRPRNDGMVTPARLPNARELRAMIRQETILHVQDEDGQFVPVWRAKNFD